MGGCKSIAMISNTASTSKPQGSSVLPKDTHSTFRTTKKDASRNDIGIFTLKNSKTANIAEICIPRVNFVVNSTSHIASVERERGCASVPWLTPVSSSSILKRREYLSEPSIGLIPRLAKDTDTGAALERLHHIGKPWSRSNAQ